MKPEFFTQYFSKRLVTKKGSDNRLGSLSPEDISQQ